MAQLAETFEERLDVAFDNEQILTLPQQGLAPDVNAKLAAKEAELVASMTPEQKKLWSEVEALQCYLFGREQLASVDFLRGILTEALEQKQA